MLPRPTSHSKALGPGVAGPELAVACRDVADRPPVPTPQQPLCGADAFMVDPKSGLKDSSGGGRQHTQYPMVTGTSVLALKYADGVLVAADTLGAYGSTKRYKSVKRVRRVNDRVVVAASGELSDFQYLLKLLDELTTDDLRAEDGHTLGPAEVHSYLVRVLYNRRNKFDPLWNTLVVAGLEPPANSVEAAAEAAAVSAGGAAAAVAGSAPGGAGPGAADAAAGSGAAAAGAAAAGAAGSDAAAPRPFLGLVGMIGTHYTDSHVTTGFGNHLARPLFRERQRDDMPEAEAVELMRTALRVCYYRDKQSINKFTLAKVTKDGVSISEPFALDTKWDHHMFTQPTPWAIGTW